MTKVTTTKLYRKYEKQSDGTLVSRETPIENPRLKTTLTCEGINFTIWVSPGELVNKERRCNKLLKEYKENEQNKR